MAALIQLTLDGSLVFDDNSVSLRILSGAMSNIQRVADRAYLDITYGQVWKHARLDSDAREAADFIVGPAEEGSYKIKFFSDAGGAIVQRIKEVIADPYNRAVQGGENEVNRIARQIEVRKSQLENRVLEARSFEQMIAQPDPEITRGYGEKAISNYMSELLNPVAGDDDAILKLALKSSDDDPVTTFTFDSSIAAAYRREIKHRTLGDPVLYEGHLRMLDRGHKRSNFKGKFTNISNDRDLTLHIRTSDDYDALAPYINAEAFRIIACPVIEYGSYDPGNGDIQFIGIARNE